MTLNEKVGRKLCALGDTPEAVASALRARGIHGYREEGGLCPLARYLHTEVSTCLWVGPEKVYPTNEHGGIYLENPLQDLPQACQAFVSNFDSGQYPELASP